MSSRVIPIAERRYPAQIPPAPTNVRRPVGTLTDLRGRPLHDLRVSVTDRCNFRCSYCMPRETFGSDYAFLPQQSLLSFEEIVRLARVFVAHGVRKLRLTGGEPLLRRHLPRLIEQLSRIELPSGGSLEIALTTNAALLTRMAASLRAAGLQRITVSLDALDDAVFRRLNDSGFPVADVLDGIDAARAAGFPPPKINTVVRRGINDDQILPLAGHFRHRGEILRFIEYMDVGSSNHWQRSEVVPSAEVLAIIQAHHALEPIEPDYRGEVAERWRYADGAGEIGLISSVTQPFCADCTRARLSTEGRLYTCLFAARGHDLRALLRAGIDDEGLAGAIAGIWSHRADRYSEIRGTHPDTIAPAEEADLLRPRIEMSYIGG